MCFNRLTEERGKRLPFAVLDRLFAYENPLVRTGIAKNSYSRSFSFIVDLIFIFASFYTGLSIHG